MDDDAQSELKRRARRRLVGATALALAAVIVLPMVMDHEPRVPAQEIQVRIPSQDGGGGLVSRILPGKGATALPPLADSQPAAQPGASPKMETKAEAKTEARIEPKADAKTEPKAEVKAEPKAEAKVEPKPAPAAAKPGPVPPVKAAEGARAAAVLSGQNGGGSEQWVVQLGAYKEEGNVKLLVKKLKEMGVPSYTEASDSPQGPRTRVRAGPFATKEAAEKAQAKAKAIGVSGTVSPK
jgi:DedD protein